MGLQEEFDKLYTFTVEVEDELTLVEEDWRGVVDAEAAAVAALAPEDWAAYLAGLAYTFADDRKPAGLSAEAEAAWYVRCDAVCEKAVRAIGNAAREIVDGNAAVSMHVEAANAYLQSSKAAYQSGDTWQPGWVLVLVVGVWHGQEAGGPDAFAAGADRTLFVTARTFLVDNAARALEIFDKARESWPSDAIGISTYRQARAALASFVGT